MIATDTGGRPTWPYEPLYKFLFAALPAWHTNTGILDVPALADHFELSAEAIYKWFRRKSIPPMRARELYELSRAGENLALIEKRGDEPPTLLAFYEFTN